MISPAPTEVPGLYALPLPTPFPIGRINTYVALGPDLTLIDTGVNSDRSYAELVEGLAALGAKPADLDRIIITHHHTDHVGLVERLVDESGAEVWCHIRCVPFVEQPGDARRRLRDWSVGVWREGGVPAAFLDLVDPMFAWFESLGNGPVRVSRVLQDGDSVELLNCLWNVLHTPGHAGDLIGFHEPRSGVMLSSDHLLGNVSSNALIEPPDPGQKRPRRLLEYMAQLQRVADLAPRIAYAGHGDPVTNAPELVAERLERHRERAGRILRVMGSEARSLYDVAEIMFPHVEGAEKVLAFSEVLGHVDWLERDGRVVRVPSGGQTLWQAVSR